MLVIYLQFCSLCYIPWVFKQVGPRKMGYVFLLNNKKITYGIMDYTCHKSLMKSEKNYLNVFTNPDSVALSSHINMWEYR